MIEEHGIGCYQAGIRRDITRRDLRYGLGTYVRGQVRRRNWRAVRNYFRNWWMAEWHFPPAGVNTVSCGVGFTRRGALRSLGRRLVAANLSYQERTR